MPGVYCLDYQNKIHHPDTWSVTGNQTCRDNRGSFVTEVADSYLV